MGCTSLESVVVPNKVTKIGKNAFKDDSSLKEITVPKSVKEIGKNAFAEIENLIISGVEGSYVSQYAAENKITFNTKISNSTDGVC